MMVMHRPAAAAAMPEAIRAAIMATATRMAVIIAAAMSITRAGTHAPGVARIPMRVGMDTARHAVAAAVSVSALLRVGRRSDAHSRYAQADTGQNVYQFHDWSPRTRRRARKAIRVAITNGSCEIRG
jgi:hypothetical protein